MHGGDREAHHPADRLGRSPARGRAERVSHNALLNAQHEARGRGGRAVVLGERVESVGAGGADRMLLPEETGVAVLQCPEVRRTRRHTRGVFCSVGRVEPCQR